MERVKAGEEVQGFGHGSVAGDRFGEGEVTKPDGTVIYEFGADHFFVLDEIVCSGVERSETVLKSLCRVETGATSLRRITNGTPHSQLIATLLATYLRP